MNTGHAYKKSIIENQIDEGVRESFGFEPITAVYAQEWKNRLILQDRPDLAVKYSFRLDRGLAYQL